MKKVEKLSEDSSFLIGENSNYAPWNIEICPSCGPCETDTRYGGVGEDKYYLACSFCGSRVFEVEVVPSDLQTYENAMQKNLEENRRRILEREKEARMFPGEESEPDYPEAIIIDENQTTYSVRIEEDPEGDFYGINFKGGE